MDARDYLANLLTLFGALIALGLVLYFAAGSRWFSFYGLASLTLIAVVFASWLIFKRYRTLGLRRWPAFLFLLLIAAACIVQIAFWYLFFSSGTQGLGLAAGRSMVMPVIESWLPLAGGLSAVAFVWLLGRGVYDN
jgi:hypothetical protein